VQKQLQKDEKEVSRCIEDIIRRLEAKEQEKIEFYQKFTIQRALMPQDDTHNFTTSSTPKGD
jgi:hypothetical protein